MPTLHIRDEHDSIELDFHEDGTMFISTYEGHGEYPNDDNKVTPVLLKPSQVKELRKALKRHLIATGYKEAK